MIVLHEDFNAGAPLKSRDLNDDGTVTTVDAAGATTVTPATAASLARVAAIQAQKVIDAADASAEAFIRARIPGAVTKAKQILADPNGATPTWTAAETRVILAALVLDLAARRTR